MLPTRLMKMRAAPDVLVVVSESPDFVAVYAHLQPAGVTVCRADGLLDAILRQAHSPASVILCDADCVDWKEAVNLFQRLKTLGAVVLLTRLADDRLWLEALDAGAFDLLEKPYRPKDLRWVVSTALKRRPERMAASAA